MQQLTVKTNNQWRPTIYGMDLTQKEREDFDYLGDALDNSQFFKYKGRVYSFDEFIVCKSEELKEWDGVCSESYFYGVLIKLSKSGDYVKVARFYS